jgi:DNA-binding beta-propeller fold protein YncE
MTRRLAFAALVAFASAGAVAAAPRPAYQVARVVPLGAPDRWDYVQFDAPSHRVYVAHGDRLTVVDGRSGAIIGEVTGFPGGTHGIAISHATGQGFTDDGEAGTARAFDLTTLKAGQTFKAEDDADAVTLDPATGHVFVVDSDPGKLTVIDPKGHSVVATIDARSKLEFAVADGRGALYVNGAGTRELLRVDARTNAVTARWPIQDCESPHGLAMDREGRRLFVSCVNSRLVVVNADTGAEVAGLPIGRGTDAAAYDPVRHRVFSSNGVDGTLTVIAQDGPDAYHVLEILRTAPTARTMTVDPQTGRLYLAQAQPDPARPPGGRPKPLASSLKLVFLDPVGMPRTTRSNKP